MDERPGAPVTVLVDGLSYREYLSALHAASVRPGCIALAAILAAAAGTYLLAIRPGVIAPLWLLAAPGAAVLVVLGFEIYAHRSYKRLRISRIDLKYTFDAEGWRVEGKYGSAARSWKSTHRVWENKRICMLRPHTKSINAIPKRCISYIQIEKIRALHENARENTGKINKIKKPS